MIKKNPAPSVYEIAAWLLAAFMLFFMLIFNLLPALLAGLLVYQLVHVMTPFIASRFPSKRPSNRSKLWAVGILVIVVVSDVFPQAQTAPSAATQAGCVLPGQNPPGPAEFKAGAPVKVGK